VIGGDVIAADLHAVHQKHCQPRLAASAQIDATLDAFGRHLATHDQTLFNIDV
jgi:hypothetical protein